MFVTFDKWIDTLHIGLLKIEQKAYCMHQNQMCSKNSYVSDYVHQQQYMFTRIITFPSNKSYTKELEYFSERVRNSG